MCHFFIISLYWETTFFCSFEINSLKKGEMVASLYSRALCACHCLSVI